MPTESTQLNVTWVDSQCSDVTRAGEDHRSLPDVLRDLQAQLAGQEPAQVPGQSLARPLHVVLQVRHRACSTKYSPALICFCRSVCNAHKAFLLEK